MYLISTLGIGFQSSVLWTMCRVLAMVMLSEIIGLCCPSVIFDFFLFNISDFVVNRAINWNCGCKGRSCFFFVLLVYHVFKTSTLFTDLTTATVTEKSTQVTSTPDVSTAMTEFITMITSHASSPVATTSTPYTTRKVSSTTSENANYDISSVMTETLTPATTGTANVYTKLPFLSWHM